MPAGRSPARQSGSESPEAKEQDEFHWDAPSPTDSESSNTSDPPSYTSHAATSSSRYASDPRVPPHSAPGSPPDKARTNTLDRILPAKPSARPYAPTPSAGRPSRPRPSGMTPLSAPGNPALPLGTGALPKSQPLARALFARMANDTPHAGMNGKKKLGSQKLIVPTKGFKRTFELDLSASELARK